MNFYELFMSDLIKENMLNKSFGNSSLFEMEASYILVLMGSEICAFVTLVEKLKFIHSY